MKSHAQVPHPVRAGGLRAVVAVISIAWMFSSGRTAQDVTPLFEERFARFADSAPVGEPWRGEEGSFVVERGRLHITSQRQNPRCVLQRTFAGDCSFSMRLMDAPKCHWSGFVAKGVYWVTVNHEFGTFSIVKRANGQQRTLGQIGGYGIYLWRSMDFVMRLDIVGKTLRGYLDGKLFVEATDGEMPEEGDFWIVGGWGTNIWVDDVVISKPPAIKPTPQQSQPTFQVVSAHCDRPDAIYHDGERVAVTVQLKPAKAQGQKVPVQFSLLDFNEQPVWSRTVSLPDDVPSTETLVITPPRRGVFKLRMTELPNPKSQIPNPKSASDVLSFSVLPKQLAQRPLDENSPFGGHPWWEEPEFHYPIARKIGMGWARDHDFIQYTWWTQVQPEKAKWRWHDDGVNLLLSNRVHLLGEFLNTPAWATFAPAGSFDPKGPHYAYSNYPPRDLNDFGNYVFQTVSHYTGRVKYWEVWNEPHYHGFWRGTPEEYARLCKAAYDAAKRADPACVVLGGGGLDLTNHEWIEKAFAAGLHDAMDALSFHYGAAGSPFPEEVAEFEQHVQWTRALMRKFGKEKPLWNTESAVYSTSFLDDYRSGYEEDNAPYSYREAAAALTRLYVVNLSLGVRKVFYYYLAKIRNPEQVKREPLNTNLLDVGGGLKPMGVAYATCADLLDGAQFAERVDLTPTVRCYLFARPQSREVIAVYWGLFGKEQRKAQINLAPLTAARLEAIDLMNSARPLKAERGHIALPLSRESVFVRAHGVTARAFAEWWKGAKIHAAVR